MVSDTPSEIIKFWQAVEVFSPQQMPKISKKDRTHDYRHGEPLPWEPGAPTLPDDPKLVWRHQVFGGVFKLDAVRDLLVRVYGQDRPETTARGASALFACTVDATGHLIEGSDVLSACAWSCGQIARGRSPLNGFQQDALKDLEKLAGPNVRSGLRVLAESLRDAIPDAVSGGLAAIVASALSILGGPLAAAGGAAVGGIASRAAKSALPHSDNDHETGHPRLDITAITGDELRTFIEMLAKRLSVTDALRPSGVRVHSYQISARRSNDEPETTFLNSFIVDDLGTVAGAVRARNFGSALGQYLTPERRIDTRERTDVRAAPHAVLNGISPVRTPPGRWVTDPDRPLSFSQQFAVNQALAELGDHAGLFAVNGPPGTGKTTMLRDLIAAIVVERARILAGLQQPGEAFTTAGYEWSAPGYTHRIWVPDSQVTGFEIVVASSNNGAVENVTAEIPGSKGIGNEFRDQAAAVDYFTDTAGLVHGEGAWAMVAARLGKRAYRREFADRFWWKSMQGILASPAPSDWDTVRAEFLTALAAVTTLANERMHAARALADLPGATANLDAAAARAASATGWVESRLAQRGLTQATRTREQLAAIVAGARQRWGEHVPHESIFYSTTSTHVNEQRELSAPWADPELEQARTKLFLAALALHKALILSDARCFSANLSALSDILQGKGHPEPAAALAAWQTLFLVVPVVSSTFASFDRLFTGLGKESLGWLLIDEAGQATPQNAVGALWRSQRAVIVGDPQQLEPVVTLPWEGQRALMQAFSVGEEWAPSRTSVQQVADRHARYGTSIAAERPIWVGTPLRVHRRCDRPMFDISNEIGYDGLMVFGTPPRHPFPGTDGWIDIPPGDARGHWIPAEGDALRELLNQMRERGIRPQQIRVLSPFRAVVAEAKKIHTDVFPEVSTKDRQDWVGTVHTMQGKEADAVVLVLGGDPRNLGARSFAIDTPNLLNVAVSRARRRLHVIGDRSSWGREGCFTVLAAKLPALNITDSGYQGTAHLEQAAQASESTASRGRSSSRRKNRFAGECSACSVHVLADGGFLRKQDGGWEVRCVTCQHLDDLAEADDGFDRDDVKLPTTVPPGSATSVSLRVLGLMRPCWKCGHDTVCLVGLYPARPARGYTGLITTDGEKAMELACRLVRGAGRADLAATVRNRYSRTLHQTYLANGCPRCDAIQGNFPLSEEALDRVASGGIDGLDTLLITDCPLLEWQAVIYDPGRGVIGI